MPEAWSLVYEGFDPADEGLRETLCALGNGRFVTRGAGEEARADGVHYPATYHAGLYNCLESEIGGRRVRNEDLVNLPNWLPLSLRPAKGEWLDVGRQAVSEYRQELDLKAGVLRRSMSVTDRLGRQTRVATTRLVSMARPQLAAIDMRITPVNWSGSLELRTGIDAGVRNAGVARYAELRGDHLVQESLTATEAGSIGLLARVRPSNVLVALAARTRVLDMDGFPVDCVWLGDAQEGSIEQTTEIPVRAGCSLCVEKTIALRMFRDSASEDPVGDLIEVAETAPDFADLQHDHSAVWDRLWEAFDVQVDLAAESDLPSRPIQLILRLHTFHLLQTVSAHSIDQDASIPARGLHGEAYRGHIFWDEMFVLPFYTFRVPEIARSLLMYRVRRLDAARANAVAVGQTGAMFPWQSGSTGREETQEIHLNPRSGAWDPDQSRLQRHVNAAVALNIWRYVEQSGDERFLLAHGAEMLVEIARFWHGLLTLNKMTGQYEIRGVMGPDEFHEAYPGSEEGGLDNNAYTNVMASWCLARACDAVERLDSETRKGLLSRLGLCASEIAEWRATAVRIYVPVTASGRIEAFSGYERLREFDWDTYREAYGDIGRLDRILKSEGRSPNDYKASKQADLCMLFYLFEPDELLGLLSSLGVEMSDAIARETIRYYSDRTSHGSTLSHLVFAAILDNEHEAWEHFITALRSDVEDIQGGTTPEGIHTAVMAGTIRQVVERFAGLRLAAGRLRICPRLPKDLQRVRCSVTLQGTLLHVSVQPESIDVTAPERADRGLEIEVEGRRFQIPLDGRLLLRRDSQARMWDRAET